MKKFVLDEGNKSGKEFLQPKAKTEQPLVVATETTSEKIEAAYKQELMGEFMPKPPMDWRVVVAEFLAKHEALHREALKVFSRQKSPILYNIPPSAVQRKIIEEMPSFTVPAMEHSVMIGEDYRFHEFGTRGTPSDALAREYLEETKSAGMKCSGGCGEFNNYAEPNQPDGTTYICYRCR